MQKKVLVSGCFDLLHSGHIAFLKNAATYGDLYVCIGSDKTIYDLKGRYPVITQDERKYMIESLACVKECKINKGSGLLDFLGELEEIKPAVFVVNEDGNTPNKIELCKIKNIELIVLDRVPSEGLPARSTTSLRTNSIIPFRIDLAGGWLDQPYVNKLYGILKVKILVYVFNLIVSYIPSQKTNPLTEELQNDYLEILNRNRKNKVIIDNTLD
jgi:cytidyltransferase-like protein